MQEYSYAIPSPKNYSKMHNKKSNSFNFEHKVEGNIEARMMIN